MMLDSVSDTESQSEAKKYVGVTWKDSNTITTYYTAVRENRCQPASPEHCKLTQTTLGGFQWNTTTRKFVNQSHAHFMKLQEEAKREEGGVRSVDTLVQYSQLCRSLLHECVQDSRKQKLQEQMSLYQMLELGWHLCEMLFVEELAEGALIQRLLEWVRWHRCSDEEEMNELLLIPSPETHPNYWKNVYQLVLRGQLTEACDLLLHHSHSHSAQMEFSSMKELLKKAPMVKFPADLSRAELRHHWLEWKGEASKRVEFFTHPELHLLAMVLCGDLEAFRQDEIMEACDGCWYELMVGKLLFTSPLVVSCDYELVYTAEGCITEMGVRKAALDNFLLAALRNDFMEMFAISSTEISNWWFVAHLANLLQHKGLLPTQAGSALKMCEFFLREYSFSLLSHQSLWQVAMDYLGHCPSKGRHCMSLLVQSIPLTTDKKAKKVLSLCKRYQLNDQVKDICKVLAMREYKRGRLGAALTWCLKGKDSSFAAVIAEKYMESFESFGEFMDLDLLDHLGDAMLVNDRLLFLGKYREFHKLYEKEEFIEAGKLLVTLLTSGTVPHRFISILLKDALGLLQMEQLVFSSKQTYSLSEFVVDLDMSLDSPTHSKETPPSSDSKALKKRLDQELLSSLRLAVFKNLARALMAESVEVHHGQGIVE